MSELKAALINRFGEKNVKSLEAGEGDFPLLTIELDLRSKITVVMTDGLSDYQMPVPERYEGKDRIELYFCLPSYWDIEGPNGKWVFPWLTKLAKHVVEKHTWFGVGHTIPNGNPAMPLSDTMRQKYLFLNEPVFLERGLQPLQVNGVTVNFLAIIPIFEDEMDYKMGKGTYKFIQKMDGKGISELLDDYRLSALKSKWRVFKR